MNWFKKFWKPASDPPGSNFTPNIQQVLTLARKEAGRLNHNFLGTEHLLLGLIKLDRGVAVNALKKLGLNLATLRMEVEKQTPIGPDRKMLGNIPYTPRVKMVIALAQREAKNLNHTYVGTEHLLLGLLREGHGVACTVLRVLNVNTEQTRLEILKELTPTFIAPSDPENLEPVRHTTLAERNPNQSLPALEPPDSHNNKFQLGPFTPRAEQVFLYAHQEAEILNHNFLGTEHVLLGLIKLDRGVAVNVLKKLGLDLESIRKEIKKQIPIGPPQLMATTTPYTPRVKRVITLAQEEAKRLSHTYVGTEHLLLGLLREGDGVAGKVLRALHVDIEQTRLEILKELDPNFVPPPSPKNLEPSRPAILREPNPYRTHPTFEPPDSSIAFKFGMFTPRAEKVFYYAHQEAERLNHDVLGTEHLLLGLVRLEQSVSVHELWEAGLDLDAVRMEVEKLAPPKSTREKSSPIPLSPEVEKVIVLAKDEARRLNHTYVGSEHLLLGLLREADGIAAKVLQTFNVDIEQTRLEILKYLDPNSPP